MKIKIIVCAVLSFFLLTSASMWEGSAAVASGGDLPEKGYFVATNSFPRNTVIDLTNLENNKSIRVIVAGNLETPGLLALVSREAANLIGMNSGSISRIRMTQPSDPIAYLRFTEENEDGISDYDSGDVITEEKYRESIAAQNNAAPQNPRPLSAYPQEIEWEPDWGKSSEIVDLTAPEKEMPPAVDMSDFYKPKLAEVFEEEELYDEPLIAETPELGEEKSEITAVIPEPEEEKSEITSAIPELEENEPEIAVIPESPVIAKSEPEPVYEDIYEYTLIPSQERPPETNGIYGIDPSSIIPGVSYVTEPAPEVEIKRPSLNNFSFESLIVSNLKAGSYYVQIAALQAPELVEGILSRIDNDYREVVCIQINEQSAYRILLGPLNQGESGALLKRFKSIGYKDAFIRSIR